MKAQCVILLLLNIIVIIKTAAILNHNEVISYPQPVYDKTLEQPKTDLQTKTTDVEIESTKPKFNIFTIGSILIAFLIPLKVCYVSESCQEYFKDLFNLSDRRKRDLDYLETVLVALLDNFVEKDGQDGRSNIQEIVRPSYGDPLLVTLAKYFDKYADRDVKKHTKALVFFLVHILGNILGIFKYFVRVLSEYHIL